MYYILILIPILILLNTFFISKIYKRFVKTLSMQLCYSFGILTTLFAFTFPLIPLTLFVLDLNFLNYYLLGIQIILVLIYIINWKWFIISFIIDWKKILIFILLLSLVILGWLISMKLNNIKFNDLSYQNIKIINHLYQGSLIPADEIIVFNNADNLIKFPLIFEILLSFLSILNLQIFEIEMIVNIFPLIIYFLIFSILFMAIFYKNKITNSICKIIIFLLSGFLFSSVNFILSSDITSWDQLIIILTVLMVWIHYSKYNEIPHFLSIIIINIISFLSIVLNSELLLISTIINLIILGISYYNKKHNATDYNLFIFFTTFISWSLLLTNINYISLILLVFIIIIYTFYFFYRTSKLGIKINNYIDLFLYKWVFLIASVSIGIIFFSLLMHYIVNSNFNVIIQPWEISNYFSFNVHNQPSLILSINIIYWLLNIFIALYTVYMIYKKRKYKININFMEISLIGIVLFWNPLSLDFINKVLQFSSALENKDLLSFKYNLQNLFVIPVVPFILNIIQNSIINNRKIIYNLFNISVLASILSANILLVNLM